MLEKLIKRGAKAFVVITGSVYDDEDLQNELPQRSLRLEKEVERFKHLDDFENAEHTEKEMKNTIVKIVDIENNMNKELRRRPIEVTIDNVLEMFSRSTNIPVTQLNSNDKKILNNINDIIKQDVIGQDEAVDKICKAIKRNRIGLSKTATHGNFLLIGETGCGKTFLAKKLAKLLFGDENKIVRFDLSEYNDKTASNKLIGANAGYVGYENGGLLTEAIKNKKHCVLLLDEIEKADKEIFNLFLQVFDEGFLTDNTGNKVDFKNVIILATSNVGTKNAAVFGKGIGFNNDEEKNKKNILNKELKKKFAPEFLNRFNDIIYFNSLSDDNLRTIITNNIEEYKRILLEKHDIRLTYFNCTIEYILKVIEEEKEFGARPIARAIEREIVDKISDAILTTDEKIGECIFTVDENGELRMRKIEASVWCGSETKILANLYEKED
jgi:ATP-dependent Clp protease ATP-binding subunit ClpC